jgi:ABC-type Fe3+-siderophore transport system permease subunit
MLYIAANLFYGVSLFFFPNLLWDVSGSSEPLGLGWIRWAGGPLIAMGIVGIRVFRNPAGEGTFITIAALSALFMGLGLLYSKIYDHSISSSWFHMTPCVISLTLFALLFWGRQEAKDILELIRTKE